MIERKAGSKASFLIPIIILCLVCFAVYFSALSNGFVYDDDAQVVENVWIRDAGFISRIFLTDVWRFYGEGHSNYYRPLMHAIYMLNYHIFGLHAWGFHLVNILFHAGVSVLVFLSAAQLFGDPRFSSSASPSTSGRTSLFTSVSFLSPPFIAALLFAVHPVNTEAVTWVAGLPELSFTFFSLLSLFLYMRATGERSLSMTTLLLSVLCFFFAALSKETALTLPVILVAYDYAFRCGAARPISRLKRYFPYLVVVGVYFVMRFNALEGFAPLRRHAELSAYQYVINVFPLFAQYLGKLVFPVNLSAFYVLHPIATLTSVRGGGSFLLTVVFFVLTWVTRKKNPAAFFSLLVIAVPLLPALYIPGLGENSFTERYLYLPSVGFGMLAALCATRAAEKPGRIAAVGVALLLIIGMYSFGTFRRVPVWKDNYRLWTDTLPKAPDGAIPQALMGDVFLSMGQNDKAIEHYQAALSLKPNLVLAHTNLGVAYRTKGWTDSAIEQFVLAVRLNPASAGAHANLGVAYHDKGWPDKAIQEFQTALKLNPYLAGAHMGLGDVYSSEGFMDGAILEYQAALRINPDFADVHNNLGIAYGRKGMIDKAAERFEAAARLRPDDPAYHYNAARAYKEMGMPDKASEHLRKAAKLEEGTR